LQLPLRAPSSGTRSETDLVVQARAGDDRAFEELYSRYRERIHAFILGRVHDHGRAEDLGQEVFISALRQLRSTDSAITLKPWLYTIARNACIDEFRRGVRAREVPLEAEESLGWSGLPGELPSRLPTPAAAVESKQALADLRGAFEGLTESQHKLLVMRELEGRSYDEIGARLGMTRPMVESGLFRARRKLGEEYEELASGRRCEQIQSAIDAGELRTARGLGIKLRRRYSRHLAHCQPCRNVAMMAGVDDALLKPRSILDKVAGLLPFPLARRLLSGRHLRRWALRGGRGAGHHAAGGLAGGGATGATGAASFGAGQAAALAALVLGGAGGGLVVADHAAAARRPPRAHGGTAVASARGAGLVSGASAGAQAGDRTGAVRAGHGSSGPAGAGASSGSAGSGAAGRGAGAGGNPGGGGGSGAGSGSGSGRGSVPGSGPGGGTGTSATRHRTRTQTSTTSTATGSPVTGVGTTVQKTVSGAGTTVNKTASGVGRTVSGVGRTVSKTVSGGGTTVNKVVSGVGGSGVGTTVQKVSSGVGTTVQKTTSGVGTTIQRTTSGVGTTVQKTTSGVATTIQKTVSGVAGGGSSGTGTTTSSGSSNSVSQLLGGPLP
jgi:RNA polymerase sigma factor (sigma-70 family)